MIGRVAARVALVAVAAVAVAWLAYDLRALNLDAQGRAEAGVARDPSQVNRALSLFSRAAHGNADPAPRIDEANFLLRIGQTAKAAGVLNAVARANPGNLVAWSLLLSATPASDPRHAKAAHKLTLLFGHPAGYSAQQQTISLPRGSIEVVPGRFIGLVDNVPVVGGVAVFVGFAVPPVEIMIVSDGRIVATGTPTRARPDVPEASSVPGARVGFGIAVPLRLLEQNGHKDHVEVLAGAQGIASQLPVSCSPIPQGFGCGS
jgi:hypothetical protein